MSQQERIPTIIKGEVFISYILYLMIRKKRSCTDENIPFGQLDLGN